LNHILLVEDDKNLGASLVEYLEREGFKVRWVENLGEAAVSWQKGIDCILLDWMLPDGQGIDLLREIRKSHETLPIILLTSRSDLVDKVVGLESGADDYLTKPFEPRELVARIRVNLRNRIGLRQSKKMVLGGIEMDLDQRTVTWNKHPVSLTKMEFNLLKFFLEYPNTAFSREELLNSVWGFDNYPTTRTVDTHILQLRQKFSPDLFETVRGIGYRFCVKK